jgi:hypothetical protein
MVPQGLVRCHLKTEGEKEKEEALKLAASPNSNHAIATYSDSFSLPLYCLASPMLMVGSSRAAFRRAVEIR